MKKQLFLLVLLAAAVFSASCRREVTNSSTEPEAQTAELHLTVQSISPMSRSEVASSSESTINNGVGFVFRGTTDAAVLDCAPFMLNTQGSTTSVKVTTAAAAVFVVTNTSAVDFSGVRTLGELKSLTADLFAGEAATQTASNLVMWGQAAVAAGDPYTAAVTLRFAPAKVNFSYTLAAGQEAELLNPEIVVLNAQGISRLFPAQSSFEESKAEGHVSLMPSTAKYYAAIDMTPFGVQNAQVKQALKVSGTQSHTFYLFENTTNQATVVAVRGQYQGQTYYYPIHFSSSDQGSAQFESILAGKIYNVSAKINHLSGGVTDPTNPVSQSSLEVTVVPAQWYTSVSWIKEFN